MATYKRFARFDRKFDFVVSVFCLSEIELFGATKYILTCYYYNKYLLLCIAVSSFVMLLEVKMLLNFECTDIETGRC